MEECEAVQKLEMANQSNFYIYIKVKYIYIYNDASVNVNGAHDYRIVIDLNRYVTNLI